MLLAIGISGRLVWPRMKFWLVLTQAVAVTDRERAAERAFHNNLRSLAAKTSRHAPVPERLITKTSQLSQTIAHAKARG